MQLDFTQFMSQINSVCPINPLPNKELVEVYIKAYYLPETSLETWTRDHQVIYNLVVLKININCIYFNFRNTRISNY